jgi:hypothetical protein
MRLPPEEQKKEQQRMDQETEAHEIEAKAWLNSEKRKQFDKDYEEYKKQTTEDTTNP